MSTNGESYVRFHVGVLCWSQHQLWSSKCLSRYILVEDSGELTSRISCTHIVLISPRESCGRACSGFSRFCLSLKTAKFTSALNWSTYKIIQKRLLSGIYTKTFILDTLIKIMYNNRGGFSFGERSNKLTGDNNSHQVCLRAN